MSLSKTEVARIRETIAHSVEFKTNGSLESKDATGDKTRGWQLKVYPKDEIPRVYLNSWEGKGNVMVSLKAAQRIFR